MVRNRFCTEKSFCAASEDKRGKSKIRGFGDEGPYFRPTVRSDLFSNALEVFLWVAFPFLSRPWANKIRGRKKSDVIIPFNRSFWVAESKIRVRAIDLTDSRRTMLKCCISLLPKGRFVEVTWLVYFIDFLSQKSKEESCQGSRHFRVCKTKTFAPK